MSASADQRRPPPMASRPASGARSSSTAVSGSPAARGFRSDGRPGSRLTARVSGRNPDFRATSWCVPGRSQRDASPGATNSACPSSVTSAPCSAQVTFSSASWPHQQLSVGERLLVVLGADRSFAVAQRQLQVLVRRQWLIEINEGDRGVVADGGVVPDLERLAILASAAACRESSNSVLPSSNRPSACSCRSGEHPGPRAGSAMSAAPAAGGSRLGARGRAAGVASARNQQRAEPTPNARARSRMLHPDGAG